MTPHTLLPMKRSFVFTPATSRDYPPLPVNPFDNPFVSADTSVVLLRFTLLLAMCRRAGSKLARHWHQNSRN